MGYINNDTVYPTRKDLERTLKQDVISFDTICNNFKKHYKK